MPRKKARRIIPPSLPPTRLPKDNPSMKIRAIRREISIVTIRADADIERAGVAGGIGVGLVAVEGVGTDGAAVKRIEAVGGQAGGRRRVAGAVLGDGDAHGAADGVAGGAVDGDGGCFAAGWGRSRLAELRGNDHDVREKEMALLGHTCQGSRARRLSVRGGGFGDGEHGDGLLARDGLLGPGREETSTGARDALDHRQAVPLALPIAVVLASRHHHGGCAAWGWRLRCHEETPRQLRGDARGAGGVRVRTARRCGDGRGVFIHCVSVICGGAGGEESSEMFERDWVSQRGMSLAPLTWWS
jgi:hypothetical protein